MATATFIQQGISIDYRPTVDVAANTVVVVNDLVGIAIHAIKANQLGSLAVEGVFEFPKSSGLDIPQAETVFWDQNESLVESWNSSGSHVLLGKAAARSPGGTTKVRVRLTQ